MSSNTSFVIVAIATLCMAAVAIPAAVIASEDDSSFAVDFDATTCASKLTEENKAAIIKHLEESFVRDVKWEFKGNHLGSNDTSLYKEPASLFANAVAQIVSSYIKIPLVAKLPDGSSIPDETPVATYHQFLFV